MESKQFTEPWHTIDHFTQNGIDVQCPKCGGHAMSKGTSTYFLPWIPTNTRVICQNCSYSRTSSAFHWSGPVNAYGRRPCGHCGHKWVEARVTHATPPKRPFNTTDVMCPKCDKETTVQIQWGIDFFNADPIDPFNGERLWYVDTMKDKTIWAYNLDHLFYLKEYFSAQLRTRDKDAGKYSTLTNLPKWMKSKKNRDSVLKSLERLIRK